MAQVVIPFCIAIIWINGALTHPVNQDKKLDYPEIKDLLSGAENDTNIDTLSESIRTKRQEHSPLFGNVYHQITNPIQVRKDGQSHPLQRYFTRQNIPIQDGQAVPVYSPVEILQIPRSSFSHKDVNYFHATQATQPQLVQLSDGFEPKNPSTTTFDPTKPTQVIFQRVPVIIEIIDRGQDPVNAPVTTNGSLIHSHSDGNLTPQQSDIRSTSFDQVPSDNDTIQHSRLDKEIEDNEVRVIAPIEKNPATEIPHALNATSSSTSDALVARSTAIDEKNNQDFRIIPKFKEISSIGERTKGNSSPKAETKDILTQKIKKVKHLTASQDPELVEVSILFPKTETQSERKNIETTEEDPDVVQEEIHSTGKGGATNTDDHNNLPQEETLEQILDRILSNFENLSNDFDPDSKSTLHEQKSSMSAVINKGQDATPVKAVADVSLPKPNDEKQMKSIDHIVSFGMMPPESFKTFGMKMTPPKRIDDNTRGIDEPISEAESSRDLLLETSTNMPIFDTSMDDASIKKFSNLSPIQESKTFQLKPKKFLHETQRHFITLSPEEPRDEGMLTTDEIFAMIDDEINLYQSVKQDVSSNDYPNIDQGLTVDINEDYTDTMVQSPSPIIHTIGETTSDKEDVIFKSLDNPINNAKSDDFHQITSITGAKSLIGKSLDISFSDNKEPEEKFRESKVIGEVSGKNESPVTAINELNPSLLVEQQAGGTEQKHNNKDAEVVLSKSDQQASDNLPLETGETLFNTKLITDKFPENVDEELTRLIAEIVNNAVRQFIEAKKNIKSPQKASESTLGDGERSHILGPELNSQTVDSDSLLDLEEKITAEQIAAEEPQEFLNNTNEKKLEVQTEEEIVQFLKGEPIIPVEVELHTTNAPKENLQLQQSSANKEFTNVSSIVESPLITDDYLDLTEYTDEIMAEIESQLADSEQRNKIEITTAMPAEGLIEPQLIKPGSGDQTETKVPNLDSDSEIAFQFELAEQRPNTENQSPKTDQIELKLLSIEPVLEAKSSFRSTDSVSETEFIEDEQGLTTETELIVTETEPMLTEAELMVTETEPMVTETELMVTEIEPFTTEIDFVATDSKKMHELKISTDSKDKLEPEITNVTPTGQMEFPPVESSQIAKIKHQPINLEDTNEVATQLPTLNQEAKVTEKFNPEIDFEIQSVNSEIASDVPLAPTLIETLLETESIQPELETKSEIEPIAETQESIDEQMLHDRLFAKDIESGSTKVDIVNVEETISKPSVESVKTQLIVQSRTLSNENDSENATIFANSEIGLELNDTLEPTNENISIAILDPEEVVQDKHNRTSEIEEITLEISLESETTTETVTEDNVLESSMSSSVGSEVDSDIDITDADISLIHNILTSDIIEIPSNTLLNTEGVINLSTIEHSTDNPFPHEDRLMDQNSSLATEQPEDLEEISTSSPHVGLKKISDMDLSLFFIHKKLFENRLKTATEKNQEGTIPSGAVDEANFKSSSDSKTPENNTLSNFEAIVEHLKSTHPVLKESDSSDTTDPVPNSENILIVGLAPFDIEENNSEAIMPTITEFEPNLEPLDNTLKKFELSTDPNEVGFTNISIPEDVLNNAIGNDTIRNVSIGEQIEKTEESVTYLEEVSTWVPIEDALLQVEEKSGDEQQANVNSFQLFNDLFTSKSNLNEEPLESTNNLKNHIQPSADQENIWEEFDRKVETNNDGIRINTEEAMTPKVEEAAINTELLSSFDDEHTPVNNEPETIVVKPHSEFQDEFDFSNVGLQGESESNGSILDFIELITTPIAERDQHESIPKLETETINDEATTGAESDSTVPEIIKPHLRWKEKVNTNAHREEDFILPFIPHSVPNVGTNERVEATVVSSRKSVSFLDPNLGRKRPNLFRRPRVRKIQETQPQNVKRFENTDMPILEGDNQQAGSVTLKGEKKHSNELIQQHSTGRARGRSIIDRLLMDKGLETTERPILLESDNRQEEPTTSEADTKRSDELTQQDISDRSEGRSIIDRLLTDKGLDKTEMPILASDNQQDEPVFSAMHQKLSDELTQQDSSDTAKVRNINDSLLMMDKTLENTGLTIKASETQPDDPLSSKVDKKVSDELIQQDSSGRARGRSIIDRLLVDLKVVKSEISATNNNDSTVDKMIKVFEETSKLGEVQVDNFIDNLEKITRTFLNQKTDGKPVPKFARHILNKIANQKNELTILESSSDSAHTIPNISTIKQENSFPDIKESKMKHLSSSPSLPIETMFEELSKDNKPSLLISEDDEPNVTEKSTNNLKPKINDELTITEGPTTEILGLFAKQSELAGKKPLPVNVIGLQEDDNLDDINTNTSELGNQNHHNSTQQQIVAPFKPSLLLSISDPKSGRSLFPSLNNEDEFIPMEKIEQINNGKS